MVKLYSEYKESEPNDKRIIGEVRAEILKKRFLELYSQTANVEKTCKILGMVRRTVYAWKKTDPKFKEDFAEADAIALEVLEDEANRRAMYGVSKPVYQSGKLAGYVQEYSDTLLIVLLKAKAPHRYKERFSGELMGANGQPLIPENKIIHVHSNVPLADDEDTIDQNTIYLPDSAVKPYIQSPDAAAEPSPSKRSLSSEDEELLGSL
jgi:hypothetical protein